MPQSRYDGYNVRCGSCRFCEGSYGTENPLVGFCKRKAPNTIPGNKARNYDVGPKPEWPMVTHDDWCGEFISRFL